MDEMKRSTDFARTGLSTLITTLFDLAPTLHAANDDIMFHT